MCTISLDLLHGENGMLATQVIIITVHATPLMSNNAHRGVRRTAALSHTPILPLAYTILSYPSGTKLHLGCLLLWLLLIDAMHVTNVCDSSIKPKPG
jgi:hypothetical protein